MRRGRFITVEGGEGAGKSTNIAYVRELLESAGLRVVVTREPGGTLLAEDIRALLLGRREEPMGEATELLLMFAARAQHCSQLIEPSLARGDWVLCDRFTDATFAYQGAGRGMDEAHIRALCAMFLRGLAPDLTLLLDVAVERGMGRVRDRGARDRFETEQDPFFERVRQRYLRLAQDEPGRFRVIDAARPLAAVQQGIREAVLAYLNQVSTDEPRR